MDAEFTRSTEPPLSVYQAVRRRHPGLPTVRVRKRTLTALSHALEDEIAERCERPLLFGGFQQVRHLTLPLPRWQELARAAQAAIVFVEEPGAGALPPAAGVRVLALPPEAPMRWEWAVVAADPAFGVVLSAWEIPGQGRTPDRERAFELMWSLEPDPVHAAARACAEVAARAGMTDADELLLAAPVRGVDVRNRQRGLHPRAGPRRHGERGLRSRSATVPTCPTSRSPRRTRPPRTPGRPSPSRAATPSTPRSPPRS